MSYEILISDIAKFESEDKNYFDYSGFIKYITTNFVVIVKLFNTAHSEKLISTELYKLLNTVIGSSFLNSLENASECREEFISLYCDVIASTIKEIDRNMKIKIVNEMKLEQQPVKHKQYSYHQEDEIIDYKKCASEAYEHNKKYQQKKSQNWSKKRAEVF